MHLPFKEIQSLKQILQQFNANNLLLSPEKFIWFDETPCLKKRTCTYDRL